MQMVQSHQHDPRPLVDVHLEWVKSSARDLSRHALNLSDAERHFIALYEARHSGQIPSLSPNDAQLVRNLVQHICNRGQTQGKILGQAIVWVKSVDPALVLCRRRAEYRSRMCYQANKALQCVPIRFAL